MNFFNRLREKHQSSRKADVQQQANHRIRLADFNNQIYIAYDNTPLIPMESSWTQQDIIDKLNMLRKGFIDFEMSDNNF